MSKPYSEACERNQAPILSVIGPLFANCSAVLEIGSGNGQHAVYFASHMPHLVWHTSDLQECHAGIRQWLDAAGLENLRPPMLLDVTRPHWPELNVDAVFSANTAHIMSWEAVQACITGIGRLLPAGGLFTLYGPFNYQNAYTSDSNARFDEWLQARDPLSAIRNFEDLRELASTAGLELVQDYAMPSNNRILYWKKNTAER